MVCYKEFYILVVYMSLRLFQIRWIRYNLLKRIKHWPDATSVIRAATVCQLID